MAKLLKRKQKHLDVCLDRALPVDSGNTRLSDIQLPHRALPETDIAGISLSTSFLGYELKSPLLISCMTGGSPEGNRLNRLLAEAAGKHGIAVGTGSIRVMLTHPETRSDFELKKTAGDVPVLANIGAAQLSQYPAKTLVEAVKSIEADGLYVHLNPAQELFQDGGDCNFNNWYKGIAKLTEKADFPILVKETGGGIAPFEGLRLLNLGVSFIDVAGSGGTDWIAVEAHSRGYDESSAAASFKNHGYPTAELLLAYRQIARAGGSSGSLVSGRIIASGGLRTPRDFAVSLACGSHLAAAALPFIRLASEGGIDALSEYIGELGIGIRAAIVLGGTGSLGNFRKSELRIIPEVLDNAEKLAEEALKAMDR